VFHTYLALQWIRHCVGERLALGRCLSRDRAFLHAAVTSLPRRTLSTERCRERS
jgi:hypothetical protein